MIVLTVFGTKYGDGMINTGEDQAKYDAINRAASESIQSTYTLYQNINVMVFIGFGFLMVFLKTNSWSAVGFNFIIACWAIQWTVLC